MQTELQRILVTTDLSDLSQKAFLYAVAIARQFGAEIRVLHVVEPAPFMAGMESVVIKNKRSAQRTSEETEVAMWLRDCQVKTGTTQTREAEPAEVLIREGKPAAEILAAAEAYNIDLIVMPTHDRGAVRRALLGSVAEAVLRQAPCPVLVVRDKVKDFVRAAPEEQSRTA